MQLKEFSLISPAIELCTVLKALETAIPAEVISKAISLRHGFAYRRYTQYRIAKGMVRLRISLIWGAERLEKSAICFLILEFLTMQELNLTSSISFL
ncbi:hypothetical protein [Halotia branconii]|uniref:Uncharacterized protein n=1 Tax=Halotia branconii CENA392 TaxID=1539056 RepID=A0AAJ6NRL6_9CYAN|nr:hypothetical protein [Halotia branconii]WGV25128.1 hypothetical protein QI031_25785 [Halotia branconii CENA392]